MTYATQIKMSRPAQVIDLLVMAEELLVYHGFNFQTWESPISNNLGGVLFPVAGGSMVSRNAISII